jgi:hypothetical protein
VGVTLFYVNTSKKSRYRDFFFSFIAFLVPFIVYFLTLCPTVYWQDSGELITAAYTLGIAHYSGYPTYTMLGKLFTLLPLGSVAFRVNLMSAFFAALTAVIMYNIMKLFTKHILISLITAWVLSFSYTFWTQSVIAEVYTMNAFFVALLIFILLRWNENKEEKFLYLFSFILGLSFTHHITIFLLVPAFIFYILSCLKKLNIKTLLIMGILFLIGLTPYLYLPIRASMNPVMNWGDPSNLPNFIAHITGKGYTDQYLNADFSRRAVVLYFIVWVIAMQFPCFIGLSFLGFFRLWRYKREFMLFLIIIITYFIFILIYPSDIGVFMIPLYLVLSLFIGQGLFLLHEFISKSSRFVWVLFIVIIILLFPAQYLIFPKHVNPMDAFMIGNDFYKPIYYFKIFPNSVNKHHYLAAQQYANYMFRTLKKDAVFIGYSDDDVNPLLYYQIVEGKRPDVKIIIEPLLRAEWYTQNIRQRYPDLNLSKGSYDFNSFIMENYMFPIYRVSKHPVLFLIDKDTFNNQTYPLTKILDLPEEIEKNHTKFNLQFTIPIK